MRNTSKGDLKREADELANALLELGRKRPMRDPIALAVEEMQFTPAQSHGLLWLGADGPMTMGELATRCGITEKTITGVVDRLEREEYVQRERSEEDRRVVHVKLTRKGQSTFGRLNVEIRQRMADLLSLIEPEDRLVLVRILRTISERMPDPTEELSKDPRKER
jgi:DNA-binding MarR family transcriptional regulator